MTAQILAAVIFVGMFALIIMDKFERQYVTLGSAALVLVVVFGICMHSWDAIKNALNLGAFFRTDFWYGASESASSGVNWSTIFFITGMMIMVEGLGKSGFFRWLCLSLAKATHYHVVPLLVCFMAMAAFLAMFIDSITVVLFLATVTLELAQILCFDPVPMILSEEPGRIRYHVWRSPQHHHRHGARLYVYGLHPEHRHDRRHLLCVRADLLLAMLPQAAQGE